MEQRTIPLLGEEKIKKLNNSHIAVFGLGGVGGFVVEGLARAGVKEFSIFDFDIVNESNKNRQIIALDSTIGKLKTEVIKSRILDINKDAIVHIYSIKIDSNNIYKIDFKEFDYVADCVDDVLAKLSIIKQAKLNNVKIITCCGTGNKLDPSKFLIKDINKTSVCPLAKKIRIALRKEGIEGVDALYSLEEPLSGLDFISSVSFVPSVAGLLIARHIILNI